MTPEPPVALTDEEAAALLPKGGTGVLSLADADTPYAVPVSYSFDAEVPVFYLRLGETGDSTKREFLAASDLVRLVVYETDPDRSWSVIATGDVETVPREDWTPDLVERLSSGELPHFEVWPETKRAIDFTIARLEVRELTGCRGHPAE